MLLNEGDLYKFRWEFELAPLVGFAALVLVLMAIGDGVVLLLLLLLFAVTVEVVLLFMSVWAWFRDELDRPFKKVPLVSTTAFALNSNPNCVFTPFKQYFFKYSTGILLDLSIG